jgi:DNA-binding CsgD family transcriptional regulator
VGDRDIPNSREAKQNDQCIKLLEVDQLSTHTIDLDTLLSKDLSPSGSFEIRGEIWKSTFGKLLQALPIPAILVDRSQKMTVMNQACARIGPEYQEFQSAKFSELIPHQKTADLIVSVLREVFATRKPQIREAILKMGESRIWARLTFRSIRIMRERFLLVMVEDLTAEKEKLALLKQHQRELTKARDELEERVRERTAALATANETLRSLVDSIEEKIREERRRTYASVQLRVMPFLEMLRAGPPPDRFTIILDTLNSAIESVFKDTSADVAEFISRLTLRELKICEMVRAGLSSIQIAEALAISVEAVRSHRHNIRKKIGLDQTHQSLVTWLQSHLTPDGNLA